MYFSWNDIDDVHGDHMRKSPHSIAATSAFISPETAIRKLIATGSVDSIHSLELISIVGKPVYQIAYFAGHLDRHHAHVNYKLADAITGELREPLTKDEAVLIAKDNVVASAKVIDARLIEAADKHHEYRERPLPAYAVSFENPDCTVYISAERGTFQTIRHDQWRGFDFLWMFHTMDYESRDDINNWLLRIFSAFGMLTVLSGFILFFISSRTLKQITN